MKCKSPAKANQNLYGLTRAIENVLDVSIINNLYVTEIKRDIAGSSDRSRVLANFIKF